MSGNNNQARNATGLIASVLAHVLLIGVIINQSPPDYVFAPTHWPPEQPVPSVEPAIDVRIMKMPLIPRSIAPPMQKPQAQVKPPEPAPPQPEPDSPPQPVVPVHPKILPPTPTSPGPPAPSPTPTLPKPPPPKPVLSPATPPATPVAPAPAPAPLPTPAPRPTQKPATEVNKALPTPTQAPQRAAAPIATAPLPLNIHKAAQPTPAGVPTLPLAPASGPSGRPGAPGGASAIGSEPPGTSRLNGLTPYPYGFMPSGGGGLRGTLVGCANAEAVRLSGVERDKCNERFGQEISAAPKLDPLSPAKRATFDKSSARDAAWTRYRDSTAGAAGPSMPGGIDHGPGSSVVLEHPTGDYPPK